MIDLNKKVIAFNTKEELLQKQVKFILGAISSLPEYHNKGEVEALVSCYDLELLTRLCLEKDSPISISWILTYLRRNDWQEKAGQLVEKIFLRGTFEDKRGVAIVLNYNPSNKINAPIVAATPSKIAAEIMTSTFGESTGMYKELLNLSESEKAADIANEAYSIDKYELTRQIMQLSPTQKQELTTNMNLGFVKDIEVIIEETNSILSEIPEEVTSAVDKPDREAAVLLSLMKQPPKIRFSSIRDARNINKTLISANRLAQLAKIISVQFEGLDCASSRLVDNEPYGSVSAWRLIGGLSELSESNVAVIVSVVQRQLLFPLSVN